MIQTLLIACAASFLLAPLGWLAADAVERLGAGPGLRGRMWALAFWAPVLFLPLSLGVAAADIRSPFAVQWTAPPPPAETSTIVAQIAPQATFDPAPVAPRQARAPVAWILAAVLLAGALARALDLLLRLGRLSRRVRTAAPCLDPDLLTELRVQAKRFGVAPPALRIEAREGEPFVTGILRATVVAPEPLVGRLPRREVGLILAHELAHLKNGDNLMAVLEEAVLAIFWFNPLLAAARRRLSAAREETCDALVLDGAAAADRRLYADTLVSALAMARNEPSPVFVGFGASFAVRRVRSILQPAKSASWACGMTASLLTVGLAVAGGGAAFAFAADPMPAARAAMQDPRPLTDAAPSRTSNESRAASLRGPVAVLAQITSPAGEISQPPAVAVAKDCDALWRQSNAAAIAQRCPSPSPELANEIMRSRPRPVLTQAQRNSAPIGYCTNRDGSRVIGQMVNGVVDCPAPTPDCTARGGVMMFNWGGRVACATPLSRTPSVIPAGQVVEIDYRFEVDGALTRDGRMIVAKPAGTAFSFGPSPAGTRLVFAAIVDGDSIRLQPQITVDGKMVAQPELNLRAGQTGQTRSTADGHTYSLRATPRLRPEAFPYRP